MQIPTRIWPPLVMSAALIACLPSPGLTQAQGQAQAQPQPSVAKPEARSADTDVRSSDVRNAAARSADARSPDVRSADAARDGQHDFDFEFGNWHVRIKHRLRPLTGSDAWAELDGTSIVRRVWGGGANLGELDVKNGSTRIEGLSMRVYSPQSRQWSIYWANRKDGQLGTAMIGQFTNGRGEFFNQEMYDGRAIYVRFIFSDITSSSFRLEQAFSANGGKDWEPNWIATFTRDAS